MINFSHGKLKLLLPTALITILLTACGGGSGGSSDGGGGFAGSSTTTNTKPQVSSESSESSSSKSSQPKSSTTTSSVKSTNNRADTTAPSNPSDFNVVSAFSDVIFLSWAKTTDNVAVTAYKLYRDNIQIADLTDLENYYADYNVAAGRTYVYGLSVGDAAGNWSNIMTLSTTTPVVTPSSSKASSSSKAASSSNSTTYSAPGNSSESSSTANSSSKSLSSANSSKPNSSSSSSTPTVMGVSFQWQRPAYRENGNDLFEYEIARYELRYKLPGSTDPITVLITSPLLTKNLPDVPSDAEFEVATVDSNGMYSRFVPIHPL